MLRFTPVFLLLAALGLAASGCQSTAPLSPRETQTTTLDAATRQATVTLTLGNALKLELPPPRYAGHVWQIVQNDTRYLQPVGVLTPMVDNSGRTSATFKGIRSGRSQLKFLATAVSPATSAAPADYYDVVVNIDS